MGIRDSFPAKDDSITVSGQNPRLVILLLIFAGILVTQLFIPLNAARAQGFPGSAGGVGLGNTGLRANDVNLDYGGQRNLLVTVLKDSKARLDRQAVVKLLDKKRDSTVWQATTAESETKFYDLDFGDYEVEVSAVGYLTQRKNVRISGTVDILKVEFILDRDPTAVEFGAADAAVPPKARKDVKHAVNDLQAGSLKSARKHLESANKLVSDNPQINFLFGYLHWQENELDRAESYLRQSAAADPRNTQTLTLLGRVQLQRNEYDDARKTLEQAVAADASYWMTHNLLADAYLKLKQNEKAQEQALLAINEGKQAGSVAQLVLGQALANAGRAQEGVQALKTFLQSNPNSPVAAQIPEMIATIERGQPVHSDPALETTLPLLPATAWGPPGVDEVKPAVAGDVACPYQHVIDESGQRIKQLVDNISRFAAVENMVHEQLDQIGNPITKQSRKFDYIATISEKTPGLLATDEYRNLRYGTADLPDGIVTMGFMTLALIFHPEMRDDFQMTCEGLGEWRGQATWLMHFQQRDDKPNRFADYVVGTNRYPMKLKGRAWISAKTFQIVRIESDLANPLPKLPIQHSIVEYGPVHFQQKNEELWLPQNVDIYFELRRHRYHRRHSFDHYMLFSVNSEDKSPLIKKAPEGTTPQNP